MGPKRLSLSREVDECKPLFLGRPNIGFPRDSAPKGVKPERAVPLPAWWSKAGAYTRPLFGST